MKSLFFALMLAMVSLSSCEFFPGDGPSGPPEETMELSTRLWLSKTEYGNEFFNFKTNEPVYINYSVKNETGMPLKWVQRDGGPLVGYILSNENQEILAVHPEGTPTVMQEGVLQPGEEVRYSWKASDEVQFSAGSFYLQSELRREFEGMFAIPRSLKFNVTE